MSDDFAVLLGLRPSTMGPEREVHDEAVRLRRLRTYLARNRLEPEEQREIIWSRFCALYLPATVDRFIDPPTVASDDPEQIADYNLHNAYSEMLVQVQHSPYFAKYMRTKSSNGKKLSRALAQRLAQRAATWDHRMAHPPPNLPENYHVSMATNACQLLSTLCTLFVKQLNHDVVPHEAREALMPYLITWARQHPDDIFGTICLRTWRLILAVGGSSTLSDFDMLRKDYKNWEVCGLPFCDSKTDLKVCARCQTVRYCSQEHQVRHWKWDLGAQHRQLCFTTQY
ncbi:hypothetical protein BOTBODRAFT_30421 [Botryobasidium botryosum FD-172 SS1]|uniref:MYND-type domain-containing protein n=1 Tax=Botryobasidium botryosum (strain FD-172 SS1) TaxID=930990 RepID=A0A067MYP8_BOTB1|nr:hypothetical protein BOTBODRAFT_30421 [Botryobasidium botryosum FD-172 SS1]